MPSKKKKYNARFPAGRIKKIMQTDEEVGKVAQAVPIIISRTLELFVYSLLTKTMQITSAKNAKTLSPSHMKQCILSESRFDFLKDLVKGLPDVSNPDEDSPTPPLTPAPTIVNTTNTVTEISTIRQTETGAPKQAVVPVEESVQNKNSRVNEAAASFKIVPTSQVPEFQISMPTSFQINQPNFYTEVNPMDMAGNPSNMSTTNLSTRNFTHTANIDEDYDT